ncbi:hypothetical protein RB195_008771 [Necator americanus]|uniref:Uncharacterized protein n=1 Tax=Necator americanus TaxID=51031 RepID=A0ABR1CQ86_NECAM
MSACSCTASCKQRSTRQSRAHKALQRGDERRLQRAEMLAGATEAEKSILYACQEFANRKTRMRALSIPNRATIASRRGIEKMIHDFCSDLFDSHFHLHPSPAEERWTCHSRGSSVRSSTCYHVGEKSYGTRSRQDKIDIYKLFTRVILNRTEKVLDEG